MFTLGEVIDEARDGHVAFTESQTPDSVLRRALNRYQRELHAVVRDKDPQRAATEETIDLDTYDFSAGHTLPNTMIRPLGGDVHFQGTADRTLDLNFIPYRHRHASIPTYPCYYLDQTIHLVGIEQDWDNVEEVVVLYVAEPTDVTENGDNFDLPDGAKPPVVSRAELEMAKRGVSGSEGQQASPELFANLFTKAEQRFLTEIEETDRAEKTYVKKEW